MCAQPSPGGGEIHWQRPFMGSLCAKRRTEGEEPEAAVEPTLLSPVAYTPCPAYRPRPGTDELPDEFLQEIVDNDAERKAKRDHPADQLARNERKRRQS